MPDTIRVYAEIDLRCNVCGAPLSFYQNKDGLLDVVPCQSCLDDAMKAGEEIAREEAGK